MQITDRILEYSICGFVGSCIYIYIKGFVQIQQKVWTCCLKDLYCSVGLMLLGIFYLLICLHICNVLQIFRSISHRIISMTFSGKLRLEKTKTR